MKKFLVLVMTLLLAVALLTACGGKDEGDGNGNTNEGGAPSSAPTAATANGDSDLGSGLGSDWRSDEESGSIGLSDTWPSGLPSDLPVYTDGKIEMNGASSVVIAETDEDAFTAYIEAVKDAGWEIEEIMRYIVSATKGEDEVNIRYITGEGKNIVRIMLMPK